MRWLHMCLSAVLKSCSCKESKQTVSQISIALDNFIIVNVLLTVRRACSGKVNMCFVSLLQNGKYISTEKFALLRGNAQRLKHTHHLRTHIFIYKTMFNVRVFVYTHRKTTSLLLSRHVVTLTSRCCSQITLFLSRHVVTRTSRCYSQVTLFLSRHVVTRTSRCYSHVTLLLLRHVVTLTSRSSHATLLL